LSYNSRILKSDNKVKTTWNIINELLCKQHSTNVVQKLSTEDYHLTLNNILVMEQFGFRCNSSTEIALYTLCNNILSTLNNRIIVGRLFCDLQKAFDCVNYDILLSKMKFYGITGVANRLIESYLRNRYQRVNINGHNNSNDYLSKWKEVHHGVPQGSVLGPLYFNIY